MLPVRHQVQLEQACASMADHLLLTQHGGAVGSSTYRDTEGDLIAGAGRIALDPDVVDCPEDLSTTKPDGTPLPALRVDIGQHITESKHAGIPALSSGAGQGLAPELGVVQFSYDAHAWLLKNKQLFPLLAT
jgi:hypothetical protein